MKKGAVLCGLIGPGLFAFIVFTLTIIKYEFLLSIGWHPLDAPTLDWPSGLAFGAYGWIMTSTFVLSGFMLSVFASGLHLNLPPSPAASYAVFMFFIAGIALAGLAFTADPTIRSTPATWHGRMHDYSFVLLGVTLMPAMILMGFSFRHDDRWKNLSLYTWITVALAFPAFWLKGAAFYVFMLAMITWFELIALRLKRITMN